MKRLMFFHYIKERKSWIVFFILTLFLFNLLTWLDAGISVQLSSIMYMNVLFAVLFLVFLLWRYVVETAYIRSLQTLIDESFITMDLLPEGKILRDQLTNEIFQKVIQRYEQQLSDVKKKNLMEHDYTAAWVHEVKAPLTAMKLMIDEERHQPFMRKIEVEWLRVNLLLDQQLSMTRLSTLESDYHLENVHLQKMVAAEVKELASWCLEKQVAVEFEGDEQVVVTDEKWSGFIIRQLLTNAVKYSPVGHSITITFQENEEGHKQIVIRDQGAGIAEHDLPRIFEKGFTGGAGRIHNAATGLGLYLAKDVATRLKISLHVSSIIQEGTTLTVTFPTENDYDCIAK